MYCRKTVWRLLRYAVDISIFLIDYCIITA